MKTPPKFEDRKASMEAAIKRFERAWAKFLTALGRDLRRKIRVNENEYVRAFAKLRARTRSLSRKTN